MTATLPLETARALLAAGRRFGDVFLLVAEADHAELRRWFCEELRWVPPAGEAVPPRTGVVRPAAVPNPREAGYTGGVCDVCQGSRLTKNGSCARCEDCGATTGCS
jgi:hypothetical protein